MTLRTTERPPAKRHRGGDKTSGPGFGRGAGPAHRTTGPAGRVRGAIRRLALGGPADPRWARPALWAVLILAAVLYGWNLTSVSGNDYYSAAVLSGTQSWKAFFFGSLDAGNYITVDKPPMSLWVMALTARLIGGVNAWSLIGPQVVMGVAAVAVLYTTVRRAFGHPAALIAALVMALTPMTVAINRDNNPDTLLVLLLVLAAWALQRSLESGRLRPLVGCAVFVGLAFNTKMLQAFIVLPAFALVHLAFAPGGPLRRFGRLIIAGVALAISSAWWMVVVDLWPAGSRPYIGGSTDNSVWDLVIGYNGLGRIFGASAGGGGGPGGGGGASFGGAAGLGRLFNDTMGGQISWLLPFAAIALVAGVIFCGRAARTDLPRAALLMWGGWLVVHFLVFSLSEGTFHPYYVTVMAPALGAVVGAGTVMMFAARNRGPWAAALPVALVSTGAWAIVLLNRTPGWNPWLVWVVGAATGGAALVSLLLRLTARGRTRPAVVAVIVGLAGALAGPAAYAVSTTFGSSGGAGGMGGGNGTNPTAGPSVASSGGGTGMGPMGNRGSGGTPPALPSGAAPSGTMPSGGGAPMGGGGPGGDVGTALVSYLVKNQGGATWLVAVSSAQSASSLILQTGKPVIAMGGFTGSDPAMTVAKLKSYFESGKLRYIMLGGDNRGGSSNSELTAWVKKNCTVVDAGTYGGTSSSSTNSSTNSSTSTTLYRYDG